MRTKATVRALTTAILVLAIAVWAEADVAMVIGDEVLQCLMSAHEMRAMGGVPCCPMDGTQSAATLEVRPSCCSVSQVPERPLGFVVSAKQVKAQSLDEVAVVPAMFATPVANHFGVRRSADAPRFVKPVLELKTDLRI